MGVSGVWGIKMGVFCRIYPNWGMFLGKIGVFDGEMREKECWMSGAAARTGSCN